MTILQASDQEIAVLALATLANILSYSDTLLLADNPTIEALGVAMPKLVEILRTSQQKPQGLYAAAGIANASFHPRLAAILNQHGGETILICYIPLHDLERLSLIIQACSYHAK